MQQVSQDLLHQLEQEVGGMDSLVHDADECKWLCMCVVPAGPAGQHDGVPWGTATAECILKQGSKGGLHACALWHLPSGEYDRKNDSSIAMLRLSTYVVKDALAMSVPDDTHYVMMQWLTR